MKVRFTTSTGNSYGQFVISAEDELERAVLTNMFDLAQKMKAVFVRHGYSYNCDFSQVTDFNCGYIDKL